MAGAGYARILHILKTRGPSTVSELAERLSISLVAIRKHMAALERDGLARHDRIRGAVGRPRHTWTLTRQGHNRFANTHEALTLEMLESARQIFGPDGLEKMITAREHAIAQKYQLACQNESSLEARLNILARLRTQEGYMAEVIRVGESTWHLIEAHCPICAAATMCQGFCRSELDIFRKTLGPSVGIERIEHVPDGAHRCVYTIHQIPS